MDETFSLTDLLGKSCLRNSEADDNSMLLLNASTMSVASSTYILIQILLCLPVKSLVVFKLVSKQWFSLISDPFFIQKHSFRNSRCTIPGLFLEKGYFPANEKPQFIILDKTNTTVSVSNTGMSTKIKQSCNGLLLCRNYYTQEKSKYSICNPTTNHTKLLPLLPLPDRNYQDYRSFSIAFNPLSSPYYKVICIQPAGSNTVPSCSDNERWLHRIDIYSSDTNSWSFSGDRYAAYAPQLLTKCSGVFWNGSLHWIFTGEVGNSLYFDIDQGLLKTMPMPPFPEYASEREIEYFGECTGHLYLIETHQNSHKRRFDILEMEIDYSGWIKKYHVNLNVLEKEFPRIYGWREWTSALFHFSVLLIEEDGHESAKMIMQIPNNFIFYNLKDTSFKIIHDLVGLESVEDITFEFSETYQFMNSLACV